MRRSTRLDLGCAVVVGLTLLVACNAERVAPADAKSEPPKDQSGVDRDKAKAPTDTSAANAKPADPAVAAAEKADIPAPPDVAAAPADAERTASGLASKVLSPGTGEAKPKRWDQVKVHYTGWTTDGKMFDSSVKRG